MDTFAIPFGVFVVGIFPFVVIAAVIAFIFSRRTPSGERGPGIGIGTTRRVFLYGLSFVALMIGATGATLLVSGFLDLVAPGSVLAYDSTSVAFGIASSTVGLGVWGVLTWVARRSLGRYPAEAGTLGRKLYVYAVLGVSAVVVAISFVQFIAQLLRPSDFDPPVLAPMVVWGLVWGWHWVSEQAEGQPSAIAQTVRRLYVYGVSVYAIIVLVSGANTLLTFFFSAAYSAAFGDATVFYQSFGFWSALTHAGLALGVVGGIWWWFHWHNVARHDQQSDLRRAVIYVLGLLGGSVSLVVAVSIGIFFVLWWLIDPPRETSAFGHFDVLPRTLAAALIAVGVWGYHASVALAEAPAGPGGARSGLRVYRYVSALVGLGTLWAGLIIVLGVAIGLVTSQEGIALVESGRGTQLASALTLMIVGAPLWTWHWQRMQALVRAEDDERGTLARRAYVFGVLGIAVLVVLIALSTVLFMVLDALLSGDFGVETVDDFRWAFAAAAVAAAVGVYHWLVTREDRTLMPEEEPTPGEEPATAASERAPKQITAAAPAGAESIVNAIAERIGASVAVWRRQDDARPPELTPQQLDDIAARVQSAPGDRVLLVLDADGVQVIPV